MMDATQVTPVVADVVDTYARYLLLSGNVRVVLCIIGGHGMKEEVRKWNASRRRRAELLLQAEFDPRIKNYVFYSGVALLVLSVVGILLLPIWFLFGRRYIQRYYENLRCELTTRALHFQKGIWFQTQRTIPLDKIQDLTFKEGPVLRYFGLSTLRVETAGQSAQSAADLSLTGIVDAAAFRETVLDQRDEVTGHWSGTASDDHEEESDIIRLLREIRDTLRSIESQLKESSP